jgi:hypothetical protein
MMRHVFSVCGEFVGQETSGPDAIANVGAVGADILLVEMERTIARAADILPSAIANHANC